jgi:rubredoxin
MIVLLKCDNCDFVYPADVGTPSLDNKGSIVWEKQTICPKCKAIDKDLLTEQAQGAMTNFFFGNLLK